MPTTVTISEFQPGPGECNFAGTTCKLRRYYNQDWTDVDGVFHAEGNQNSSTDFFDEISCTLLANTITVPAFPATPTDNPQTGSGVQEIWQLWDQGGSPRNVIFEGFIPSANPTITFGALKLLNRGQTLFESDAITRLDQWIQSYINTAIGTQRLATSVIAGWTRLSLPAVNSVDPIAIGSNDPTVLNTVISAMGSPYNADNTGTSNAHTAIQNAIDAADSQGGGIVFIPQGLFKTTASLEIPEYVTLMCSGIQASRIWYQGTDYAVKMGTSAASYTNGMALQDCEILLANTNGKAVYMLGARLSRIENVYIEGVSLGNGRGVDVDSSILSRLGFVICSHLKNGFKIMGSAPFQSTTITLDCCHVGEASVVPGSVGLEVVADSGEGTCQNTNFENMDTAILTSTGHGMRYIANRFEGIGTWAADIGSLSYGNVFDGNYGLDEATVRNNSGAGFNSNMFHNNIQSNGSPYPDLHVGASTFLAFAATDTPITATGFPGQSVDILTIENSSNTAMDGVNSSAKAYTGNGGTPLAKILKGSVTIDPASINGNTFSSQAFTLSGAATDDTLILNPPAAGLTAGMLVTQAFVSGANQITVCFYNTTGAPIDLASASWTYQLIRAS